MAKSGVSPANATTFPSASSICRLLSPRSIAIVGASPTEGSLGHSVLQNLQRAGYGGEIHLVNPRRAEIGGRPCAGSIAALPAGIDCVVLAIPGAGVAEAVQQCGDNGVGGIVIFSAGFAEEGSAGRSAQADITRLAETHGMAVEGPNCLGLVNYVDGVPLTFVDTPALRLGAAPGIAIISQSGALAAVVSVGLHARHAGLSYSISTGNEAASGVEDYLAYLLDDPHTAVLAMVVEQFRRPAYFLQLAAAARARGKPIVLLHPGRSAAARQSAATHTGALAGDHAVMRTKVAAEGVVLAETLEQFLDVAELLLRCPIPAGRAVAILTESGAFRALSLDFCESVGLALPEPGGATLAAWRSALPSFVHAANPLDLTAQGLVEPELYGRVLEPLLVDSAYHAVVLSIILTNQATAARKIGPIAAAIRRLRPTKPVLFAAMDDGAPIDPALVTELRDAGVPFFPATERAYRALATLMGAGQAATRVMPPPTAAADQPVPAGPMPEYRAKQLLAAAGIAVPPGALATSAAEAIAIAARIGYPVVLKAQAAALSHKSDVGGVMLNLGDAPALEQAWQRMQATMRTEVPHLALDGILVETMARRGIELIVGARRDPDWGAVLLVGLGGVTAEAFHDIRLLPADLPEPAIAEEILKLHAAALLRGFRGTPAADVAAAAAMVGKLGQLILGRPDIAEIDVNPLVVWAEGDGVLALDAVIVGQARPGALPPCLKDGDPAKGGALGTRS